MGDPRILVVGGDMALLARAGQSALAIAHSDDVLPAADAIWWVGADLRKAKALARRAPLIVIADVDDPLAAALIEAGADDVVHPARLDRLPRATRLALARRRQPSDTIAQDAVDAFTSGITHDLREPMRALEGFSQMLIEDYAERLGGEAQVYLSRIRAASRRLSGRLDGLRMISRLSVGPLSQTLVDLTYLSRDIIATARSTEPTRNVDVQIAPSLRVNGDLNSLRLLLEQLISNAWKFTAGRAVAHIEIGRAHPPIPRDGIDPDVIPFFIRDDGVGFGAEHATRIFRPFMRYHSADEFEGTGLGLAIAERIVRRHNGQIWAISAEGQGATFYFTLER